MKARATRQGAWSLQSRKRIAKLDGAIADSKRNIRHERSKLQKLARERATLKKQLKQFGIGYAEQGAEGKTHGRDES